MKKQTFVLSCSFDLTYTFPGKELVQDTEGNEGEMEPRERAIEKLQKEIEEHLRLLFADVSPVRCFTDCQYRVK